MLQILSGRLGRFSEVSLLVQISAKGLSLQSFIVKTEIIYPVSTSDNF